VATYEYESYLREKIHFFINELPFYAQVIETLRKGTNKICSVINITKENHLPHIHLCFFLVLEEIELLTVEEFKS
jgi:hypothetical protein